MGRLEIGSCEDRARHYRMRAEEIRAIIDTMVSAEARLTLQQVVHEYEALARSYEAHAGKPDGRGR